MFKLPADRRQLALDQAGPQAAIDRFEGRLPDAALLGMEQAADDQNKLDHIFLDPGARATFPSAAGLPAILAGLPTKLAKLFNPLVAETVCG